MTYGVEQWHRVVVNTGVGIMYFEECEDKPDLSSSVFPFDIDIAFVGSDGGDSVVDDAVELLLERMILLFFLMRDTSLYMTCVGYLERRLIVEIMVV